MPSITNRNELRKARSLDFCYLCGREFEGSEEKTRDHVPPKKLFHKSDRDPPLILPAHESCNKERSIEDEVLGQLVSVIHGTYPRPERVRLNIDVFTQGHGSSPMAGLRDFPLRRMVFRCARGFHAALYREHVPDGGGMIYAPFPAQDLVDGDFVRAEEDPGRLAMTQTMRQHRIKDAVDHVECFNGKCVYDCVWPEFDNGRPFCLFALRIYEWEVLGDPNLGPPRGCLGWYFAEPPRGATRAIANLDAKLHDPDSLDPFA